MVKEIKTSGGKVMTGGVEGGVGVMKPPPATRKYYTTSQLMSRWGVSAPTVIRLIEEGSLWGLKIRGVYRVAKDAVESYERKVSF